MLQRHIKTGHAPGAIGPYSQGVLVDVTPQGAGQLLVTAGQIALDPVSGEMVPGGVAPETERALQNLSAILEAEGLTLRNVIKTTVYLATMEEFAAMNEVYAKFFPERPPARSTVAVSGLPRNARVEIEAWAAR